MKRERKKANNEERKIEVAPHLLPRNNTYLREIQVRYKQFMKSTIRNVNEKVILKGERDEQELRSIEIWKIQTLIGR